MSQSEIDRDRMITEMHSDLKHLVKNFDAHTVQDDTRQKEITGKIEFHQKIIYCGIGVIAFIEFFSRVIK